ncbi:hypothetical protein AVEN_62371-1 [Araneus ventricosus]|uniref:Uncharacterized protein n=1 Tax=Araneus ventricosus TaxID=182803 RepID=A0A4Y2H0W7_ARAVE|nr:hypothetical protein AVEN_62371-1 [Araneus ventricosus]
MSIPEALESCEVPMQLPTFLFENQALEHPKIQKKTSMRSRSRKQVDRKMGRALSLRDNRRNAPGELPAKGENNRMWPTLRFIILSVILLRMIFKQQLQENARVAVALMETIMPGHSA